MTNKEKLALLRTAKPNTIIGMSVRYNLKPVDQMHPESPEAREIVKKVISNIEKSWKDNPALVESCFFNVKDLF